MSLLYFDSKATLPTDVRTSKFGKHFRYQHTRTGIYIALLLELKTEGKRRKTNENKLREMEHGKNSKAEEERSRYKSQVAVSQSIFLLNTLPSLGRGEKSTAFLMLSKIVA
jgi:hypothetical protein